MARRGDGSSGRDGIAEGGRRAGLRPPARDDGRASATRLPTFTSTFLGRDRELDELARLLRSARLVTLTGLGGIGKTRLAVELARRTAARRARFVDLAPLRDERLVAERVGASFGLGELRGRDLALLLDAALSEETLLVMDNCEHVTGACAAVARDLLAGCAPVRILATSQQRLGVPGEIEWLVPPLELPETGALMNPEDVRRTAAVRLFYERALAATADFVTSADGVEVVLEICRRLDANPLAIELAAARVRTLSPAEIAARLERRFQLLHSPPGATEGRYPSLAAALAWSHDLLSAPEKELLRRLSVFAGTFGYDAVEAVCAGGDVERESVLDVLSGLITKSLVAADTSGQAARYRLPETVRLYAAQRLAACGEGAAVGERHARWCVRVAEGTVEAREGALSLEELEAEVDNVRSALQWCVTHEQTELGLRLAVAYMLPWSATGRVAEAREWLGRVLAVAKEGHLTLRAQALHHAAFAAVLLGDFEAARRDGEASVAASSEADGPPWVIERTKGLLAMVSTLDGGPSSVEELERDLDEARAADAPHLTAALVACGHARLFRGEPVAAEALFDEVVGIARRRRNVGPVAAGLVGAGAAALVQGDCGRAGHRLREGIAVAMAASENHIEVIGRTWLAEVARVTGKPRRALRDLEECAARARPMGSPYPLALSLLSLGRAALDEGDAEAARLHLDEALALAGDARLGHIEAGALEAIGETALALGDPASAEALFTRALAVAKSCAEKTATARATYQLAERARARSEHDRATALHHDALQQLHAVSARPGIADSLDALGGLAVARDNVTFAARLFGAAAALRSAGGWARRGRPQDPYPTDVARLRQRMGADELEAAWAAGAALGCEDAVAYASRGRGRRARAREGPSSLTRAERAVVALAVEGLSTDEIAARLFISPRTVHSHLARVYAKLGVTSRRELRQRVGPTRTPA